MMLLIEPTSLQAARTASVARESSVITRTIVKLKMATVLHLFITDSHSVISLLTSCCTFFEASVLIQHLLDTLSELAMSAGRKKAKCCPTNTFRIDLKELISSTTHLCFMKTCINSGFSLQSLCTKFLGSPECE